MKTKSKNIFIAGTNTDVGKTYVSSLLAKSWVAAGHRVGVYKPVASGCVPGRVDESHPVPEIIPDLRGEQGYFDDLRRGEQPSLVAADAMELWLAAGRPGSLEEVCPQRFLASVAPPVAARAEGRMIDVTAMVSGVKRWAESSTHWIVEGAGGLLSPLADDLLNVDYYRMLPPCELWIVAANRLGTIHQTLATCEAANARGCPVSAIVLNEVDERSDDSTRENLEQIRRYSDVPVLGCIAHDASHWDLDESASLAIKTGPSGSSREKDHS